VQNRPNEAQVKILAERWKLDCKRIESLADLALKGKTALLTTGLDEPIFRKATRDRPNGAVTAAYAESIPRNEHLVAVADALTATSNALNDPRVVSALEMGTNFSAKDSIEYDESQSIDELDELGRASALVADLSPSDRCVLLEELLLQVAAAARTAVPKGKKHRPSLWASWEGDAVSLAHHFWFNESKRKATWNRKRRPGFNQYNAWQLFCLDWLELLGVEKARIGSLLTEEPPPLSRLFERLEAAGLVQEE
jgi:hypothetical protein